MRPSDSIKPLVEKNTAGRLRLLVAHRKAAYLDLMTKADAHEAQQLTKAWRKYQEALQALEEKTGRKKR